MKKKFSLCLVMLMLAVFAVSCASTSSSQVSSNRDRRRDRVSNAPDWFNDPGVFYKEYGMDIIVGVGQANRANDPGLSESAATAAARVDIAQELSIMVKNMFEDYALSSGYDPDRVLRSTEEITKTITAMPIQGSKIIRKHITDNGTAYVAVMLDQTRGVRDAERAMRGALRGDEILGNLKREEYEQKMEAEITKMQEAEMKAAGIY